MGTPRLVCIVALDLALNATRTTWCTQVAAMLGFGACSARPPKGPPHAGIDRKLSARKVPEVDN